MWRGFLSGLTLTAVIAAVALLVLEVRAQDAQPPSASDIADGLRLYEQKGNCQACQGGAGDGRKADSQMPDGANLPETSSIAPDSF